MSLTQLQPTYLAAIEAELRRAFPPDVAAGLDEYYDMLAYHLGWSSGASAGKRIRPLLCVLCCAGAGGHWKRALPIAAAVELIHNFSLIHDDIQDRSELRRGRPTVWVRWGMAQAINAGDAMFVLAHLAPHRLLEVGVRPKVALEALAELDSTCLALTQGQYLDMAFEHQPAVSVAEYLVMIQKKTAALIAAAAHLGALVAEADGDRADDYFAFGLNLGLAFQLQDDLLGIWGDPGKTGKSTATDLETRKKSLPVVYGLERSAAFAAAYAQPHAAGTPVDDLAAELEQLGARGYVEAQVQETTALALRALDRADPAGPAGAALRELTEQLLGRQQ